MQFVYSVGLAISMGFRITTTKQITESNHHWAPHKPQQDDATKEHHHCQTRIKPGNCTIYHRSQAWLDNGWWIIKPFQNMEIKCQFILGAKLDTLSEDHKCKTLLWWSGDNGLELYIAWEMEDKDLTLDTIWTKFEEHCKPQANELCAHYDLLKQGDKSCDEYYALLQNQSALCQYQTETQNILEWDVFLFGITDQAFMSKCIAGESNLTTAEICQRLIKLESSKATAKHITRGAAPVKVNQVCGKWQHQYSNKGKWESQDGINTTTQQHQQQEEQNQGKQNYHPRQDDTTPPRKKQMQNVYNTQQNRPRLDPSTCMKCSNTRHKPGFTCPTSQYQCKKCQKYGHFTPCCLTTVSKVKPHKQK